MFIVMSNDTTTLAILRYNDLRKNHKLFRIPILYFLKTLYHYKGGLSFANLKSMCGFKDGDLSKITSLVESYELIDITRVFENKRSKTTYKLTDKGILFLEQFSRDIIDTLLVIKNNKDPAHDQLSKEDTHR
jgi:DNA-binding PadR family transcriptional regulator